MLIKVEKSKLTLLFKDFDILFLFFQVRFLIKKSDFFSVFQNLIIFIY